MKNTANLNVLADYTMTEDTLVIHPNDGFDLGMMTVSYPVYIFRGCSFEEFTQGSGDKLSGKIHLKNECRNGTIEMSKKSYEKLGKPKKIKLYYEEPNLLLYLEPEKEEDK